MNELYNTVRATYEQQYASLKPRIQLHFASRLYLWQQDVAAANWLKRSRADFTCQDQPLLAVQRLIAEPQPPLRQTGTLRAPYFTRYPDLRTYDRALFRLLFMNTLYGLETRAIFDQLFPADKTEKLYNSLLEDTAALAWLSSFGINYLYLLKRFVRQDKTALPLEKLLETGRTSYGNDTAETRLRCYFYTHCIIGETLFYARSVGQQYLAIYQHILAAAEQLVDRHFSQLKIDNLCEFLVCCRILGHTSPLEGRIAQAFRDALSTEGYLQEPADKRPSDLSRAEHRNVLFLMSQRPYRPLLES